MSRPLCLVLPSTPLDGFILAEQVQDLARADGVVVRPPPRRLKYGMSSRLPEPLARLTGRWQARGVVRAARRDGTRIAAVLIYHPVQWYLARAILAAEPAAELWYSRWDRYEWGYATGPRRRRRLAALHDRVAARSVMTVTCSVELQRLERAAGRDAILTPLSADTFPAPDPVSTRIGVWRGPPPDWRRVRERALRRPGETLLLVDPGTAPGDPDYEACRSLPNVVLFSARSAGEAERLASLADYAEELNA